MQKKKRFLISINLGISSTFVLIIIITSLVLSIFSFLTIKGSMRTDLTKRMHDILALGKLAINADDHIQFNNPGWKENAAFQNMFNALTYIKDSVTDVKNVYTMNLNEEGKLAFIVDTEPDEKLRAAIGEVYADPTPELASVFEKRDKIYIEKNFSRDKWGVWISGYVPLFTSNKRFAGILGIDISAQTVVTYERQALLIVSLITLCVVIGGIILAIFFTGRITKPLSIMERDIARIQRLQFDDVLELKTIFKEIKSIDMTVDNVKASLRSFQKYVPADLVRQLIALHKEAVLGGEKKNLTIYFSDIKDSTTFSESMPPEELITVLGKYFEGMTGTLLDNHATIDKYIGDCIMAFWNAPNDDPQHALHACEGALATKEFLKHFNGELEKKGHMQLATRIGINTGEVIVGNIGYESRFNYTVMGDPANVASRMEGLNKYYGTEILITEQTFREAGDAILARAIDRVIVKGKTKGIMIYELLAARAKAPERLINFAATFDEASRCYFNREWEQAVKLCEQILTEKPGDGPALIIRDRCQVYLKNPPSADWDGVHIAKEK